MSASLILCLTPEVVLDEQSAEDVPLQLSQQSVSLPHLNPGVREALRRLSQDGATRDALRDQVLDVDGPELLPLLYYWLNQLSNAGLLVQAVVTETGQRLATAVPVATHFQPPAHALHPDQAYVLSRFALIRRHGNDLVLESPLAGARVVLHDMRCATLLHALATGKTVAQLVTLEVGLSSDVVEGMLGLLLTAGLLTAVDDVGGTAEDANPTLVQWEFHDLLMHARCRRGRHRDPFGGTYRFQDTIAPLPAVKPRMSDDVVVLYTPDMSTLQSNDVPFSQVLELRQSLRAHGTPPLSDRQLGEFLYRVARVKAVRLTDRGEVCWRPYPAGGALHELELYPLVQQCQGIAAGLYHYMPLDHQLCRLSAPTCLTESMLRDAAYATGEKWEPQVLILIAARFQRVTWKYASMAYTTIQKNVGALYQTMYLVGTAMGLAPCGIGAGNADLFAQATGTDYYAESSVGEFLLGSRVGATPVEMSRSISECVANFGRVPRSNG
jgi:SagB-type dehydrogenase family enzyme